MDDNRPNPKVPPCRRNRIVEVPIKIKAAQENGEVGLEWSTDYPAAQSGFLSFRSLHREMYNLRFKIEPNEVDLKFAETPLAAFWVAVDSAPAYASYVRDFEPVFVSDDGQELLVLNINRSPANYCFSMNFDSRCGALRLVSGSPT